MRDGDNEENRIDGCVGRMERFLFKGGGNWESDCAGFYVKEA